ncbi:beta-ketoacyl-ACP reductase [Spirochaetia bacterium]|nr:beta-ketoacyl-ACP reductase [Spirochaetia bacterium]
MDDSAKPFDGKNALVIGGTGGIGRAVALLLAEKGARLTLLGGSSKERLEAALTEIRKNGGRAEGFLFRVDTPDAAERILERSPNPDILICAWGPFKRGALADMVPADWRDLTLCNLVLPGTLVSLTLPSMMRRGFGRILLFGGTKTDTIRGFTSTAVYSAAKTALGVLAKSAAREGGPSGVTCNVLCPGLTDTEYLDDKARSYNAEQSPGGKPLIPDDIARAALAILENPQINGAIIPVDRGIAI